MRSHSAIDIGRSSLLWLLAICSAFLLHSTVLSPLITADLRQEEAQLKQAIADELASRATRENYISQIDRLIKINNELRARLVRLDKEEAMIRGRTQ